MLKTLFSEKADAFSPGSIIPPCQFSNVPKADCELEEDELIRAFDELLDDEEDPTRAGSSLPKRPVQS